MNTNITPSLGRAALRALFKERSPLGPLKVMAQHVGRFFQIPLPMFKPYVVFGPDANRKVLVTERDKVLWRNTDPVTDLLRLSYLSQTYPGKTHDKKVADTENISYPQHIALHKDTGFQGYEPNVRKLYQPKKSLASKN